MFLLKSTTHIFEIEDIFFNKYLYSAKLRFSKKIDAIDFVNRFNVEEEFDLYYLNQTKYLEILAAEFVTLEDRTVTFHDIKYIVIDLVPTTIKYLKLFAINKPKKWNKIKSNQLKFYISACRIYSGLPEHNSLIKILENEIILDFKKIKFTHNIFIYLAEKLFGKYSYLGGCPESYYDCLCGIHTLCEQITIKIINWKDLKNGEIKRELGYFIYYTKKSRINLIY